MPGVGLWRLLALIVCRRVCVAGRTVSGVRARSRLLETGFVAGSLRRDHVARVGSRLFETGCVAGSLWRDPVARVGSRLRGEAGFADMVVSRRCRGSGVVRCRGGSRAAQRSMLVVRLGGRRLHAAHIFGVVQLRGAGARLPCRHMRGVSETR